MTRGEHCLRTKVKHYYEKNKKKPFELKFFQGYLNQVVLVLILKLKKSLALILINIFMDNI